MIQKLINIFWKRKKRKKKVIEEQEKYIELYLYMYI